ncbi:MULTISPECIES: HAD-IA family hydrolase [unclassified Sphingomonas]|jgi:HAD superfamily hydrolase (TIGR01509 family)|uniref:HAD-IA family hydrolase n=1 Tax=unclassified Sphingomonas TaxID=196159 RepID=UPI00053D2A04|nr:MULTISPECIES: HAD-IA family hydrolase [unclassified Sphingomonas]
MKCGLRGLFLDFDGTIAETERIGQRVAYNRAFAELGLDWFWDEALYGELLAVAGGKERLRFYLERQRPELLDDADTSALIAEIHRAKIRHFAEIAPAIPLRPGLLRLVREADAAGVMVAIATTASKPGVEALLSQDLHLPAMINLIAANEAVERKKPEPDIYVWALARLGLEAADCVAIEDSSVGLRAALAAHLQTIVTVSDYTTREDFAGATAVLSNLGEPNAPALSLHGARPEAGIVDLAFLEEILNAAGRQAVV